MATVILYILRTLITTKSTPFDTHTYAIIYNGMQHILDTHAHDTEAKLNCIDIDPDNGEEQFYNTAHFYDRLKKTVRSYEEEDNIESLRESFKASSEIHAIINYARMLDINLLEFPSSDLAYNTVRMELNRYVRHWWNFFSNPKGPHPTIADIDNPNVNSEAYPLLVANVTTLGNIPFEEQPTFQEICNIFTCFAARLLEATSVPLYNAHLVFNHLHQLYHDIIGVELRHFKET